MLDGNLQELSDWKQSHIASTRLNDKIAYHDLGFITAF